MTFTKNLASPLLPYPLVNIAMTQSSILQAKSLQSQIISQRRHFHQNPELSFNEIKTGSYLADQFSQLGYKVTHPVAKTGLLADLLPQPKIAVRADMDALPIQEENDLTYKSTTPNVMHACGHDAHMAIALACANLLSQQKNLPVRFLLQPAEENSDKEGKSGAYRMIEAGALANIQAIIGLHVDSTLKPGQVAIASGPVMAASDSFTLKIIGSGGHGAFPESTIDAVVIQAYIITQIQQIISRKISAFEPGIITIGSVKSSSNAGNVISDYVEMKGTIRSFNKVTRDKLVKELDNVCKSAINLGGNYEIKYEFGYPATVNDKNIAQFMKESAANIVGEENVVECTPKLWSEDFSMYQELIPGAFMFLGAKISDAPRCHHNPKFDIDESGLYYGAAILADTVIRLNEKFVR